MLDKYLNCKRFGEWEKWRRWMGSRRMLSRTSMVFSRGGAVRVLSPAWNFLKEVGSAGGQVKCGQCLEGGLGV